MAFNLTDLQVQILDQIDGNAGGVTVDAVNVTSLTAADVDVSVDPSTKLGSAKVVASNQFQTISVDYLGIKLPDSLSFAPLSGDPVERPGAAGSDGVFPIQPGTNHSLTYGGFGFFHATSGIYGSAGLSAHQAGITSIPAGWLNGTYSASPAAIAAGAEVPCRIDVMGGSAADASMGAVNSLIAVNSVTIAGREAAHRTEFSTAISLVANAATSDSLLPEGKQLAKLKAQAWDGTGYSVAEMAEAAFTVALRPISGGSATLDGVSAPASVSDPASYSGPSLTAGTTSGQMVVTVADSAANACLGTALNHALSITHDVFTSKQIQMQGSLSIDATGKIATQNYSVTSDCPTGVYNIEIGGDQNGSNKVLVGQVVVDAADIVVAGETFVIQSVTPGDFDSAENGMAEWGEKTLWNLSLASGANLPGVDEGTFLYAYLTKGATRFEFVDGESVILSDNEARFQLDLTSAASAAQLDGATFHWAQHTGDFTLHLEVYDRSDEDPSNPLADPSDMFGRPAAESTPLSTGSFSGVLITSEAPQKAAPADFVMDGGGSPEYAGVMTPEIDRWIQAGTTSSGGSTLGAARNMKYLVLNAASPSYAPGANDGADLHQTYVQIIRTSDGAVVGDSRQGASKLAGGHGDGSGENLFLISSLVIADRVGGSYPAVGQWLNAAGRDQLALASEISFDVQAIHELGDDSAEPGVGVQVAMDVNNTVAETPIYQVEIVTRAVDMGASESALIFAGDRAFRTFPAQIETLAFANALIPIGPSGTTLYHALQLLADDGLVPVSSSGGAPTLAGLFAGVGAGGINGSGGKYTLSWDGAGEFTSLSGEWFADEDPTNFDGSNYNGSNSYSMIVTNPGQAGDQRIELTGDLFQCEGQADANTGTPVWETGIKHLIYMVVPTNGPEAMSDQAIIDIINAEAGFNGVTTTQVLRQTAFHFSASGSGGDPMAPFAGNAEIACVLIKSTNVTAP